MRNWKLSLATLTLAICGAVSGASSASAQIGTYYSAGYGVPVYSPSPATYSVYSPQVVMAPPVVVAPQPLPLVTTYRPVLPTYVAPAAVYSTYRPVYPTYVAPAAAYSTYRPVYPVAPVTVAPATVVTTPVYGTAYRSGYVGAGLGGAPSLYTPGQPVRNALRYIVP